jgi:hypothetical protein
MQTTASVRAPFTSNNSSAVFRKRSSPPSKETGPQPSSLACDGVSVSAKATESKPASNLWSTAVLGGMAALSLAGCASSGALNAPISEAAVPELQSTAGNWEAAPVELLRAPNGEVVINLGIDNQVVNPDTGAHYQAPGANNASWSQRGETICQQALDIGGECEASNIATVPTPHGTLIIEQNDSNTIDVYSQDGGHTGVSVQAGGVDVQTYRGGTYFANDGSILHP